MMKRLKDLPAHSVQCCSTVEADGYRHAVDRYGIDSREARSLRERHRQYPLFEQYADDYDDFVRRGFGCVPNVLIDEYGMAVRCHGVASREALSVREKYPRHADFLRAADAIDAAWCAGNKAPRS